MSGTNRSERTPPRALRVFLTQAPSEQTFAATLAADLRQRGIAVESDPADAIASALLQLVQSDETPDWLIVALSPSALWSPIIVEAMRVAQALLRHKRLRGVLAIVAAPCQLADIPPDWPITQVFDAIRDYPMALKQLTSALGVTGAPARTPQGNLADQETMRLPSLAGSASEETMRLPAIALASAPSRRHGFAVVSDASAPPLPSTLGAAPHTPLISRRTLIGAGALVVASALAGGGSYIWRTRQKAPPPPGPTVRWRYHINSRVTTAAVEAGDFIYLGAQDGHFYALDGASHTLRWRYQARAAIDQATPVAESNAVYFCANDGSVNKLSNNPSITSDTQRLRWRFRVPGKQFPAPALGNGILYATAGFNGLFALDSQTGAIRWRTKPTFNPTSPPTLDGARIYVAAAGSAYALNANGGAQLWQTAVGGAVYSRMPVVNGLVYVSSLANAVYALDADTGKQRWRFATTAQVFAMPVVDTNLGAVYIGGSDNYLYALDAASGALRWQQKLDSPVTTPKLIHGRLYVISSAGYLYALNPANGSLFWQYVAGEGAVSPLGVGANTLYIGSADGYLYALGVP